MSNTLQILRSSPDHASEVQIYQAKIDRNFDEVSDGKFNFKGSEKEAFTVKEGTISSKYEDQKVTDGMVNYALKNGADQLKPKGSAEYMERIEHSIGQAEVEVERRYPVEKQMDGYQHDNYERSQGEQSREDRDIREFMER